MSEEIKYTCFYLGDTLCGIEISIVNEINDDLSVTQVPLAASHIVGVMNLRGQIITVIDQKEKLGLGRSKVSKSSRVIIVRNGDEVVGLLVDRISDVITTTREKIVSPPSNVHGLQGDFFQGVIHTESNELLAILNLEALLEEDE